MNKNIGILAVAFGLFAFSGFQSCSSADGDKSGSEYMPDMGHSIAYEANTYGNYYQNNWDTESQKEANSGLSRKALTLHNKPVEGTVPRGYAGVVNTKTGDAYIAKMEELKGATTVNAIATPINGKVPYYIENTEAGRTYANTAPELRQNPFPIAEKGLKQGKELYEIYCGICHGNKGDGNGWLVDETNKNSKYLAAPTNYLSDDLIDSENGRYYHTIMHGKGVMGAYADKLSYEERWQVIHYIRSLQAKQRKVTYNHFENKLNAWATPIADTNFPTDLSNSDVANELKETLNSNMAANKEITLEKVFFNTGSAELKAESKLELNELTTVLNQYPSMVVELAGHTDNVGSPEGNKALSNARANAVRNFLISKGLAEERLKAVGYGDAKPIADNSTDEGKAKNRRTAFSVLSK